MSAISKTVQRFIERGVKVRAPATVDVGEEVRPDRVAPGAEIFPGCRLYGALTSVGPGCVLGAEAPLTLQDAQLGPNVKLKGGFVDGAVFLDGASLGSAAHVRPGSLLEEHANGAHAVGFKQTILFPYVTTGSLINFCDVLMAGGTGPRNHSEVGSSYVHFNFTPRGDKAAPSMMGDVPRGVWVDQPPIFLGGQGGTVGPTRIEYGCVVPAGVVCRRDALEPGRLVFEGSQAPGPSMPYTAQVTRGVLRTWRNNVLFIANLRALQAWYQHVRALSCGESVYDRNAHAGALELLARAVSERIKRLDGMVTGLDDSIAHLRGEGVSERERAECRAHKAWPHARERLAECPAVDGDGFDRWMTLWQAGAVRGQHLETLASLSPKARDTGRHWLQSVVEQVAARVSI